MLGSLIYFAISKKHSSLILLPRITQKCTLKQFNISLLAKKLSMPLEYAFTFVFNKISSLQPPLFH